MCLLLNGSSEGSNEASASARTAGDVRHVRQAGDVRHVRQAFASRNVIRESRSSAMEASLHTTDPSRLTTLRRPVSPSGTTALNVIDYARRHTLATPQHLIERGYLLDSCLLVEYHDVLGCMTGTGWSEEWVLRSLRMMTTSTGIDLSFLAATVIRGLIPARRISRVLINVVQGFFLGRTFAPVEAPVAAVARLAVN